MNEQLQRLARQSGFYGTGFHNTLPGTAPGDALKNFAELIIRMCANELRELEDIARDEYRRGIQKELNTFNGYDCAEVLEERFLENG